MDKNYLTEDLPETKSKPVPAVTGVEKVVMTVERVGKQIKTTATITDEEQDSDEKTEAVSGKQLLTE